MSPSEEKETGSEYTHDKTSTVRSSFERRQ